MPQVNIDELIVKFGKVKQELENVDFSQALVVGVNAAKAKMQFRIFNLGRDKFQNPLGKYKRYGKFKGTAVKGPFSFKGFDLLSPYEKKRVKAGRQVIKKDLEFTGALRRGIVVLKENNARVICYIPNAKLFLIAESQETDLNTQIFGLSTEERKILTDNTNAALKQLYDRIFNTSRPV